MVIAIHNIKATLYSFILASFKGVSQVLLIENAISGFIITAAIMAANFSLGIITLLSAMIGTWIGFALVKDKAP
ncbi:MAG TPA: urea transporter, partial [Candidatus Paenibacillus intestinavium]|nr:urea transporter [Candidatus Paenibacillus intestinavium]